MNLNKLLCCLIAVLLSLAAQAQQNASKLWLSVSLGSIHAKQSSQYNQNNFGLGVEWEYKNAYVPNTQLVMGRFLNSDNHYSNYAGVLSTPLVMHQGDLNLNAGVVAGTINGYPRAWKGAYFPLLAPVIELKYHSIGANVFVIPPIKGIPATLAFQMKIGF